METPMKKTLQLKPFTVDRNSMAEIIRKNRPLISDSTIDTYTSCIQAIGNGAKVLINSPKDFITHFEPIMKYLMSYKPNSRKTKIASLVVYIDDKHSKHSEELDDILKKYRDQMFHDSRTCDKEDDKQELSKSQKENFIPWEEVVNIYNELKEECLPMMKLESLSERQFFIMQEFVLLSCYVLPEGIPRRSKDFCDFKIRNFDDKSHISKDNYMVVQGKTKKTFKGFFVFNSYKNSKKIGSQTLEIPEELRLIIQKWTKLNPYDYLIINNKFQKTNHTYVKQLLNKIFKKRISSSMLRHIKVTKEVGDVDLEKLRTLTESMGNNKIEQLLQYVQKDSKKVVDENEKRNSDSNF